MGYSEKECISELKRIDNLVEGTLSRNKFRELGEISATTVENKFGSWNEAKEFAGIKTNSSSKIESEKDIPDVLSISEDEWKELDKNVRSRKRKQALVAEIKLERGCKKCGYDKNPVALDFHHDKPNKKDKSVGVLVSQGYSKQKILKEVEICSVLCANCHRIEESGKNYSM